MRQMRCESWLRSKAGNAKTPPNQRSDVTSRASQLAEQEQWQRDLGRALAESVKRYLEQSGKLQHRISSLQPLEMEGIAWNVIAEYHKVVKAKIEDLKARQINYDGLRDPADKYLGTG